MRRHSIGPNGQNSLTDLPCGGPVGRSHRRRRESDAGPCWPGRQAGGGREVAHARASAPLSLFVLLPPHFPSSSSSLFCRRWGGTQAGRQMEERKWRALVRPPPFPSSSSSPHTFPLPPPPLALGRSAVAGPPKWPHAAFSRRPLAYRGRENGCRTPEASLNGEFWADLEHIK